jgi:hypothetical protein
MPQYTQFGGLVVIYHPYVQVGGNPMTTLLKLN